MQNNNENTKNQRKTMRKQRKAIENDHGDHF